MTVINHCWGLSSCEAQFDQICPKVGPHGLCPLTGVYFGGVIVERLGECILLGNQHCRAPPGCPMYSVRLAGCLLWELDRVFFFTTNLIGTLVGGFFFYPSVCAGVCAGAVQVRFPFGWSPFGSL